MKLLRAIRFDGSDERVFDHAAAPDEWVISGAFAFTNLSPDRIVGRTRQAFANGFLGLEGFGRSTFAVVAEASAAEVEQMALRLADHFIDRYGAPDQEAALPAAREELAFIAGLCAEVPINTIFTVRRRQGEDGEIREEFRTVAPPAAPAHARIWDVVEE